PAAGRLQRLPLGPAPSRDRGEPLVRQDRAGHAAAAVLRRLRPVIAHPARSREPLTNTAQAAAVRGPRPRRTFERNRLLRKKLAAMALLAALAGCSSGSISGSSQPSGGTTKLTTVTPAAHGAVSTVTWDLPLGEPSSLDWIYAWDYGSDNTVLSNICES